MEETFLSTCCAVAHAAAQSSAAKSLASSLSPMGRPGGGGGGSDDESTPSPPPPPPPLGRMLQGCHIYRTGEWTTHSAVGGDVTLSIWVSHPACQIYLDLVDMDMDLLLPSHSRHAGAPVQGGFPESPAGHAEAAAAADDQVGQGRGEEGGEVGGGVRFCAGHA